MTIMMVLASCGNGNVQCLAMLTWPSGLSSTWAMVGSDGALALVCGLARYAAESQRLLAARWN